MESGGNFEDYIRFLFCHLFGPVNHGQNWKGWERSGEKGRLDSRLTVAYPLGVLLKGSVSPVSHCLKGLCRFDQIILFPLLVEFPDHVF